MFDESRIQADLEEISFPRRYGTDAEKKAFALIKKKIDDFGLKSYTQLFKFTNFYSNVVLRICVSLIIIIILFEYRGMDNDLMFPSLIWLITICLVMLFLSKIPDKLLIGKKLESQNLLVKMRTKLENGEENDKKTIIFMAHIDSKGQTISIAVRVYSYYFWIASLLLIVPILFLRFFLHQQYFWLFHEVATILTLINFISGILILINFSNNKSYGALDDGSGVVILLELLNYYINENERPSNINLWFLFTGAEECGTMGARFFLKGLKNVEKSNYLFLNFDVVGTGLDIVRIGKKKFQANNIIDLIIETGKKNSITLGEKKVIVGVHTDSWMASKKRFKVIDFGDRNSYKYVHSNNDTPDKIDCEKLRDLCKVLALSIKEIDDKYRIRKI